MGRERRDKTVKDVIINELIEQLVNKPYAYSSLIDHLIFKYELTRPNAKEYIRKARRIIKIDSTELVTRARDTLLQRIESDLDSINNDILEANEIDNPSQRLIVKDKLRNTKDRITNTTIKLLGIGQDNVNLSGELNIKIPDKIIIEAIKPNE